MSRVIKTDISGEVYDCVIPDFRSVVEIAIFKDESLARVLRRAAEYVERKGENEFVGLGDLVRVAQSDEDGEFVLTLEAAYEAGATIQSLIG